MELDQFIKTLQDRKKNVLATPEGKLSGDGTEARPAAMRSVSPVAETRTPSSNVQRDALEQVKRRIHALLVEKLNPDEFKVLADDRQRTE